MNAKVYCLLIILVGAVQFSFGQGNVGIGVNNPNKNAVLELVSSGNNQGLLVPRLTTAQRTASSFTTALTATENGLLVFDSDDKAFYYWQTNQWLPIAGTLSGSAGGDLTGNYPSPSINDNTITSAKIVDGTIVSADIADGTITAADLSNLSISDSKIASGITATKLTPGSNGQVLTTTAGAVGWAAVAGGTLTSIGTGTGLTGGPITTTGTIALSNTAVTAGSYGSASAVPVFTVDAQGRITGVTNTSITGVPPGGTAGGDLTGNYPSPTINASAVTSAKIADGTIADADISATAAIAASKLAVGTVNQVLTTSGGVAKWADPSGSSLINNAGTRNLFAGGSVGGSSGTDNAFFGASAGNANTSGNYNVVFGSGAGRDKTVGDLNTLIGWLAGQGTGATATFNGNTFLGAQSGQNTTGGPNTFLGEKSGQNNTTGTQSLFAGNRAGLTNTTGTQNTILGYYADVSTANLQNATAIGYSTIVNASNKVRLGNAVVTVIEGQVPYTSASDFRFKTNISALSSGLDFILKLNPVSYQMKTGDSKINWGFIAQEVEKLVSSNNAVVTVGADKDRTLGLRYTDFVAPLVKAVQEQQTEIELLRAAMLKKEEQVRMLEESVNKLKSETSEIASVKDQLERIKKSLGIQ